jgi:hypothetical protein
MSLVSSISTAEFSLASPIPGKGARPFLYRNYVRNRSSEEKKLAVDVQYDVCALEGSDDRRL